MERIFDFLQRFVRLLLRFFRRTRTFDAAPAHLVTAAVGLIFRTFLAAVSLLFFLASFYTYNFPPLKDADAGAVFLFLSQTLRASRYLRVCLYK